MNHIESKTIQKRVNSTFHEMKHYNEIAFTYYHAMKELCAYNKTQFNEQMALWRKQFREKKIKILPENNMKVTLGENTAYMLVVQPTDDDACPTADPLALLGFNEQIMVSGYAYFFTSEANRNMVYQYVTKSKK